MKVTSSSVFIICITLSCFVQSEKPRNTLTELSKSTNLTCCSQGRSVVWKHQQMNDDEVSDQICSGLNCKTEGYSIDNSSPGCFHLIINSTSIDTAGLYQCDDVSTSNVSGAYLVVYNFSCSDDFDSIDDLVEGDQVKFHCSVSWRGKWPFEVRWLDEHGIERQRNVIFDFNPFYNNSFVVNVSRPNFPPHTVLFGFLDNAITDPNVDKSCPSVNKSSLVRNVMYRPSNIKLSCPVERCERIIDDSIKCSADGYPIPEYHWLNWNDEEIATGPVLQLKSLGTHSYNCVATNIIRRKNFETSKIITVNVNSKPYIDSPHYKEAIYWQTGFIVLILIVIVILVIILVFAWWLISKLLAKRRAQLLRQQMEPRPEPMELRPELMAPQPELMEPRPDQCEASPPKEKITTDNGKPSLPPGEQNDHNVQIDHKEYNNNRLDSANFLSEVGPLVTFRPTEIYQPESDVSENEGGSDVCRPPTRRHAHPETESLLTPETDAETERESIF